MVTLNRIYTRTGDDGSTGLIGGARIKKNSARVSAYGDIDELNSHLGLCTTLASEKAPALSAKLLIIQNELFDIGSELACPPSAVHPSIPRTTEQQVARLESWIDELNASLPQLTSFVLPGGTLLNSYLHISRAVARRAERSILELNEAEPVTQEIRHYINRLSDLLFVMSRTASSLEGASEVLWTPGATRKA